jgi:hypothetical protein
LRTTPQQTVHLNSLDSSGQFVHVGLIIPRLDIKSDSGLSDGLGLVSLLGGVLSKTLSLELLGSLIDLFVIRTEKIDIFVLLGGSSSRSSFPMIPKKVKKAILPRVKMMGGGLLTC